MATFTTPRTWVAGELVTASMMNTHVRDNLVQLKTPPSARYNNTSYTPVAVSSSTWVEPDTSNLTVNVTTAGGRLKISWQCLVYQSGGSEGIHFNIGVDGAYVGDTNHGMGGIFCSTTSFNYNYSTEHTTAALSAGAHTVKIFAHTAGSTVYMTKPSLFVQEI